MLTASAAYIDIWKFGWGTAYVDAGAARKLALLSAADVRTCLGGTLLEIAWPQGEDTGVPGVGGRGRLRLRRGVARRRADDPRGQSRTVRRAAEELRRALRGRAARTPTRCSPPQRMARRGRRDLDAGARWVVTEGRESGTVGIYRADGRCARTSWPRRSRGGGVERMLFEAPRKDQQAG